MEVKGGGDAGEKSCFLGSGKTRIQIHMKVEVTKGGNGLENPWGQAPKKVAS